jgi:hypothetical protein
MEGSHKDGVMADSLWFESGGISLPCFAFFPFFLSRFSVYFVVSRSGSGLLVQGTIYAKNICFCHVCVNHRCLDVGMAQEFLHSSDIVAIFKQMSGEAVSQHMWGDLFSCLMALRFFSTRRRHCVS